MPDPKTEQPLQFSYDKSTPAPSPEPADDVPEAIRELRAADPARALFSPQKTYAQALEVAPDADEATKAQAQEWREVFADVGLNEPEARDVVMQVSRALADGLPSEATRASWRAEASASLQRQYGAEAQKVLAEAVKFVSRDGRLQHFLQVTGLGDHPSIVRLAIQKSRR